MSAAATSSDGWTAVVSRSRQPGSATSTTATPSRSTPFSSSRRPFELSTRGPTLQSQRAAAETSRTAALDFSSSTAYPSLTAAKPIATAAKSGMNFRSVVAATAARDAEESVTAIAAADAYEAEYTRRRQAYLIAESERRNRLAAIGTRCFDDGPEDYDGPEEDEDDTYVPAGAGTTDDWEDASGDRVEDDHVAIRRRGDKGVW